MVIPITQIHTTWTQNQRKLLRPLLHRTFVFLALSTIRRHLYHSFTPLVDFSNFLVRFPVLCPIDKLLAQLWAAMLVRSTHPDEHNQHFFVPTLEGVGFSPILFSELNVSSAVAPDGP
jgi:hypothetical protein